MEEFVKKAICGIILLFLIFNYSYAYSDIDKNHWAYEDVDILSKKGILSGYPDGSFKPENNMTRAEFITILIKIIEPNADVSSTLEYWAEGTIRLAKEKNILIDSDYSEFDPDKDITRREICLMLYRSIKDFSKINLEILDNKKFFSDIDFYNEEEIRITSILSHLGILNGYPDKTARLNKNSTRAETCSFINNFMKSSCNLVSILNDSETILYEGDIPVTIKLPEKLRRKRYSKDIPYITTEIKEIDMFEFNCPPDKYKDVFKQFTEGDNKYLSYRQKFGENNYVLAVQFSTTNNTYNDELYGGYEFLHVSFPEEEIDIIDAFDTDEIARQVEGNANVGMLIYPGETMDTSAFYVINKLPKNKIRFDRDITDLYTSFHSLIINLEGWVIK